jgi:Membrane transport protein
MLEKRKDVAPYNWQHFMIANDKRVATHQILNVTNSFYVYFSVVKSVFFFRWGIKLPRIANNSLHILSDGGLGMAMFSLGTIEHMSLH